MTVGSLHGRQDYSTTKSPSVNSASTTPSTNAVNVGENNGLPLVLPTLRVWVVKLTHTHTHTTSWMSLAPSVSHVLLFRCQIGRRCMMTKMIVPIRQLMLTMK
jgi:hypothetical protein